MQRYMFTRLLTVGLVSFAVLLAFVVASPPLFGQEEEKQGETEEVGIRDNSFLIEESYNQEAEVVQHIANWVYGWDLEQGLRTRTGDFRFTQEWPIGSQRHQFSYSIPLSRSTEQFGLGPIAEAEGIGDIMLNYRFQVLGGQGKALACAPRFSIILPSGDENQGLGFGTLGYQFNLPVSKEFERCAFHFNAGTTVYPHVTAGVDPNLGLPGRTLNGYNLGGSAIYFAKPNVHLVLETLALWDENLTFEAERDRGFQLLLNPGVRWAPFTQGQTQWVLGLAAPIGLSRDAPDFSLFFYLSFEHPFTISRGKARD